MHAVGEITACYTSIATGRVTEILKQKNLILFDAADVMASLLAGKSGFSPSHMYFHYENTNGAPVAAPAITRSAGRTFFEGLSGADNIDWLRVPIITTPKLSKVPDNSADYANNAIVFNASSGASETLAGESPAQNYFAAAGADGPSKVISVALVSAPTPSNNKLDKVFSRVNLTAPLSMQPGHHLTFYWLIKFN